MEQLNNLKYWELQMKPTVSNTNIGVDNSLNSDMFLRNALGEAQFTTEHQTAAILDWKEENNIK